MQILRHYLMPIEEVISRLKKVRLKGMGEPLVYERADLTLLKGCHTDLLTPPQRYVLVPGIELILELAEAFQKLDVDVFALEGALFFWPEGTDPEKDQPIPFLPPIVESSVEPHQKRVNIINDGMHRVYSARKTGRTINVILASGVPEEYPYYAYALAEGWSGVEEIPELTDGYKKKAYRIPDNYKALFRDFDTQFPGIQKQRKQTEAHLKA